MKKNCDKEKRICNVGGQALMEGILMLGPHGMAQVVRNPEGELVIDAKELTLAVNRNKFFSLPIIRGGVTLVDSMARGMKALFASAEIAASEEDESYKPSKFDLWIEKVLGDKAMNVIIVLSVIISVIISVGLFFIIPYVVSDLLGKLFSSLLLKRTIESVVRILIFLTYMILVSKMKDIRRVFMYHGAEHKTIHCYEHDEELTVDNVRKYSKHHPRCGTAFLFVVMIISILVYAFIPDFRYRIFNVLLRIALIPLVAGIAYEFNRYAGKHENPLTRVLRAPGMAMQRFTTFEPDDSMMEVAIVALNKALEFEQKYEKDSIPSYSAIKPEDEQHDSI